MSIGAFFTELSVNMASVSHPEDEEEEIMLHSKDDPWIKHLNTLWKIHFEKHEPPMDDKLI